MCQIILNVILSLFIARFAPATHKKIYLFFCLSAAATEDEIEIEEERFFSALLNSVKSLLDLRENLRGLLYGRETLKVLQQQQTEAGDNREINAEANQRVDNSGSGSRTSYQQSEVCAETLIISFDDF